LYITHDANMDGVVKYTGGGNDRGIFLSRTLFSVPTAVRLQQLP